MGNVKEFHTPIERKRPSSGEWEFCDSVGQYEIHATECVIDGKAAWLVKVQGKTYWAEDGKVSLATWDGSLLEKFGDPVDINLQGCICEALGKFEKEGAPDKPK
jgi:hypothetical protein